MSAEPAAIEPVTRYVLGFLFTPDGGWVVMIRKRRPVDQAGKLNGVGGKIEGYETVSAAVSRECFEETGVLIAPGRWAQFATLEFPRAVVHCLRAKTQATGAMQCLEGVGLRSQTDEEVSWEPVCLLSERPLARHVHLLVHLALSDFDPVTFRERISPS